MPKLISTSSDFMLTDAGTVSAVLVQMIPVVPAAEQMHADLIGAANNVEVSFTEMLEVNAKLKATASDEKKSGKDLRNGVFGLIGFVEVVWPEINARLPILSKFDVSTSHVVADEMAVLVEADPELRKLGYGLRNLKERHLKLVAEARHLKRRWETTRVRHRGAQLDLRNRLNEARKFILNSSTPEADFNEVLRNATRKPNNKKKKVEESVPAKDAAPANDTKAAEKAA